jgi:hypothetical protein
MRKIAQIFVAFSEELNFIEEKFLFGCHTLVDGAKF